MFNVHADGNMVFSKKDLNLSGLGDVTKETVNALIDYRDGAVKELADAIREKCR